MSIRLPPVIHYSQIYIHFLESSHLFANFYEALYLRAAHITGRIVFSVACPLPLLYIVQEEYHLVTPRRRAVS